MIANSTASDSPAIGIAISIEIIRRHSMIKVLLELLELNVVSLSCLLDQLHYYYPTTFVFTLQKKIKYVEEKYKNKNQKMKKGREMRK